MPNEQYFFYYYRPWLIYCQFEYLPCTISKVGTWWLSVFMA